MFLSVTIVVIFVVCLTQRGHMMLIIDLFIIKLRNEIDTNRTSEVLGEIKVKLSKVLASVLQATRDLERDFSKKEKHFNTIKCNKKRKNEEKMDLRKKSRRDK